MTSRPVFSTDKLAKILAWNGRAECMRLAQTFANYAALGVERKYSRETIIEQATKAEMYRQAAVLGL